MLNDHPYVQQNSKVQNKYSIPINLSQQLNQQSGQDYKTPQWNSNTNQTKPQTNGYQQYQFQQPQFQESYSQNIGRNHQRNPYLPSNGYREEEEEQYQYEQQQQQQQYQYEQEEYYEQPREYYQDRQIINQPQQPIYYPEQPINYPTQPLYQQSSRIYYPAQQISYHQQPLLFAGGGQHKSYMKEYSRISGFKEYPFREETLEDIFDKGLINMGSHEKELEDAKLALAMRDDFRIQELFSLFDQNGTGSLIPEELMMGLNQFNLQPQLEDILMLFDEYGMNRSMDFQQFGQMIYPISIKNEMTKCNNSDSIKILPETKLYVRKVFVALLNAENAIELLRHQIIDLDKEEIHGKIFIQDHFNDLKHYIYSKGQYFDYSTIQGIFRRLDRNCTQIVSPQEFTYVFSLRNNN